MIFFYPKDKEALVYTMIVRLTSLSFTNRLLKTIFLVLISSSLFANYNNFDSKPILPGEEFLLLPTAGNADAIVAGSNPNDPVFLGPPDGSATHIWSGATTTLDLTDVIPAGESIDITLGHIWNTDGVAQISSSANSASGFSDMKTYGSGSYDIPSNNTIGLETITYTATVDVRYIRISVTNQNIQLDAISYSFEAGCGLTISSTTSENCSGSGPYTADLKVIVEYSNEPSGDIMYEWDSDPAIAFTPNNSPDTITLLGIPADAGSNEIKVYFANETTCGDTVTITRPSPCPYGLAYKGPGELCDGMPSEVIGGTVFQDWNYDGVMNQVDTIGLETVAVYLYDDCSNFKDTTYTDSNGNYLFENLNIGTTYRVEFEIPSGLGDRYFMTQVGSDNGGVVQFVGTGNCANLGISSPNSYCQDNPPIATTCFVAGNPSWHSATSPILVSIDYNSGTTSQNDNSGLGVSYTNLGDLQTVGSIYGIAYSKKNDEVYSSAFFKMVSEFPSQTNGSDDPSIIYKTTGARSGASSTSSWVTLTGANSAGTDPFTTGGTTGGTPWAEYSNDALTNAVGRIGYGDIELSLDEDYLYAWNMNNRKLYELNTNDGSINNSFDIPSGISVGTGAGDCPDQADLIPGAVKVHPETGDLYIGVTCSCESNGDASKLRVYVYELDPTTGNSYERLNIPLNYDRARIGTYVEHPVIGTTNNWNAWVSDLDTENADDTNPPFYDNGSSLYYYPQPWLLDLEFDEQDFMVLAINDRFGNQYGPGCPGDGNYAAGDILIAAPNTGLTNWTLENDGSVGSGDSTRTQGSVYASATNDRGPGGSEFFYHDRFGVNADGSNDDVDIAHGEIANGGILIIPGAGEVVSGAYDPAPDDDGAHYGTGGVIYLSTRDGSRTRSAQLYAAWPAFGKANGIGDLEVLCDEAPLEIGQYIWVDTDGDGIHDGCESGLSGVAVQLFDNVGTLLASTTSDSDGKYYFSKDGAANQTWVTSNDGLEKNTDYYIVIGNSQFSSNQLSISGNDYELTQDSLDNGEANPTLHDSDAEIMTSSPASAFDNMPATMISIGAAGKVDHSIGFGFIPVIDNPAAIGNLIWIDENTNGIPDAGESGIAGIVVELQDGNCTTGVNCPTTITDANGGYIFKNISTGNYTVKILSGVDVNLNAIYDEDQGTTNPDMETSVTVNPGDEYLSVDFGYNYVTKTETDNPSTMNITGALGNRVWNDANSNGVQDAGETGIENITVNLYDDTDKDGIYDNLVLSTTTDANGNYIFDNLTPEAYVVEIMESDISNAGFTTTPTADPDADSNNISNPIIIAPGDVWLEGDFGYKNDNNPADIGSTVFVDRDANGSYLNGVDIPMANVTVALVKDTNGDGDWDTNEMTVATTITAMDGTYLFPDVVDGDYVVVITDAFNVINDLSNTADPDGGNDNYSAVTISGSDALSENFGYVPAGHTTSKSFVGDMVFLDADGNGSFSTGDTGIEGVEVELLNGNTDAVLEETKTDENGLYFFGNLDDGDYKVKVKSSSIPSGLVVSVDPDGSAPANETSASFNLMASGGVGVGILTKDFGYKATTAYNILGTIWEDASAEGTKDASEVNNFENVSLALIDVNGNIISTTSTAANGTYTFAGIPNGDYTIQITDNGDSLRGYWHSIGTGSYTDPIAVTVNNANISDMDFGYYKEGAAIGNLVWLDYNGDGIQDDNEPGLEGAIVKLEIDFNNDTNIDLEVATVSDMDGFYTFDKLLLDEDYQGDGSGTEPVYTISVSAPNNAFTNTVNTDQGGNDNLDAEVPSGIAVTPQQGKIDVALTNITDGQSSIDFAFDFDCTQPSVEYAITIDGTDVNAAQTTDYFLVEEHGKKRHKNRSQKNGVIRSNTYCVHGEWRYYFNPLDPDEYLFAIRMNSGGGMTSNTTEIEYIELRLDDNGADRYVVGSDNASYVMQRDWHVKTKDDAALTAPVDIRFYFPPNEFEKMYEDAIAQATASWGVGEPQVGDIIWFKKDTFDPDNDINENGSILTPYDITTLQTSATDSIGENSEDTSMEGGQAIGNNKNHIQFDGITGFSGGTAMLPINRLSLPVELSLFEAKLLEESCNVKILWRSESEEKFDRYELERSDDGITFINIHTESSQGGTFSQVYSTTHQVSNNRSYFRLKMIDLDGSFEYSKIITVQSECERSNRFTVYPNPINSKELLNIDFDSDFENVEIQVTDMLGRVVKKISLTTEIGMLNKTQIDISELPNGMYKVQKLGNDDNRTLIIQE